MLDITRAVKPPRAAFLDFPPGHTSGPPFAAHLQRAIVHDALSCLERAPESGSVQILPYAWPGGDGWRAAPLPERLPRAETPQYQTEADRAAARDHAEEECAVCLIA